MKRMGKLWFGFVLCILIITGFQGCFIAEIVETVVDVPITVVETAVDIPVSIVEAAVDIPPDLRCEHTKQQEWVLVSEEVTRIDAETVNGSIEIIGTDSNQILVRSWIDIHARSEAEAERFAEQVYINVVRQGNTMRIYKSHPNRRKHIHISVRYVIETPHNMDLDLKTTNGRIRVCDTQGNVNIKTTNGSIDIDRVQGAVYANTSNGPIHLDSNRIDGGFTLSTTNGSVDAIVREGIAPIEITTTNGSIHLSLPDYFNGYLNARTSNGNIRSEAPVSVYEIKKNRLNGHINGGGNTNVILKSTNGNIRIHKTL